MRLLRILAITALLLPLAACSSRPEAMVASAPTEARGLVHSSPLFLSTSVGTVTTAKEKGKSWEFVSEGLFREGLQQSLGATGLLATDRAPIYIVDVVLIDTDQPIFGADFTVTSTIDYTIRDNRTNSPVFKERVVAPFTAKFSEAFLGAERARVANEGSMRANIEKFLGAALKALKDVKAGSPIS